MAHSIIKLIVFYMAVLLKRKTLSTATLQKKTFTKIRLQCCDNRCDERSFKVKGRIDCYNGDLYTAGTTFVAAIFVPTRIYTYVSTTIQKLHEGNLEDQQIKMKNRLFLNV